MSEFKVPKHMEKMVVTLARVKALVPQDAWIDFLREFAEVTNIEVLRFTRTPPKHDQGATQLGWFQGRGTLAYELGACFDECTAFAQAIRKRQEEAQKSNGTSSPAGPSTSGLPRANSGHFNP